MKYTLLITFLLGSLIVKAQFYGFPNSGMETWTNNTTIANWTLSGGSILKVEHIINGAFGAALKNEAASSGKLVTSFPFTAKVPRAIFDYKFVQGSTSSSDTGQVDIMLTRWNTGTNSREIIARMIRTFVYSDGSWQTFSFPFTYFNTTASPDSSFVFINSSINSGYNVNTTLNVDNFAYLAPDGITSTYIKNTGTSIYPNPVKNNTTLTYELKKDSKVTISISDINGKVVASYTYQKPAGVQQEQLNFESLKSGIYFYEIKSADEVRTGKFTISK